MKSDQVSQWMRNNSLLISPHVSSAQTEAVERFLSEDFNLESLLQALGFERSSRFGRSSNELDKLSHALTKKSVPFLRTAGSKEFPETIKRTLRELDCPLLWIEMPRNSKVASDIEIVEGLIKQFGKDGLILGEVLGEFLHGRHDVSQYFNLVVASAQQELYSRPESISSNLKSFSFGFFLGLKRVPVVQVDFVFQTLDPKDIMELAAMLDKANRAIGGGKPSGIEVLDKRTFLTISRRIIDEDFERQSDPETKFEFHGPFDPEWDSWIASKLQSHLGLTDESPNDLKQSSPFTFTEYIQMRDAFSPYSFPKTAAALVHVAYTWFDQKLEDLTFDVLESLVSNPERTLQAVSFLDAVLEDQNILTSLKAKRLLESIEKALEVKNHALRTNSVLDLATKHEVRFAATIAKANNLALQTETEAILSNDPQASSIYLSGGRPSIEFIRETISRKDVEPYIAILNRIANQGFEPALELQDLTAIRDNFETVLTTSVAHGLRNSPGTKAGQHFKNAETLENLYPSLDSEIQSVSCISCESARLAPPFPVQTHSAMSK